MSSHTQSWLVAQLTTPKNLDEIQLLLLIIQTTEKGVEQSRGGSLGRDLKIIVG